MEFKCATQHMKAYAVLREGKAFAQTPIMRIKADILAGYKVPLAVKIDYGDSQDNYHASMKSICL